MNEIKDLIKNYRLKNNLSQEELAIVLGVTRVTISRYESGTREPSVEMLKKISETLDIPSWEMLGKEDNQFMIELYKYFYSKDLTDNLSVNKEDLNKFFVNPSNEFTSLNDNECYKDVIRNMFNLQYNKGKSQSEIYYDEELYEEIKDDIDDCNSFLAFNNYIETTFYKNLLKIFDDSKPFKLKPKELKELYIKVNDFTEYNLKKILNKRIR